MFKNVSTLECREKISRVGLSEAIFLSKPCFKDLGIYILTPPNVAVLQYGCGDL